ncbi:MAG TPA: sugar ABC transporter permease [Candidatus Sumerlaeota bacterium]|nr:sugar ABC transporter permease [Candidatus Sumerlaeota bacterium]
MFISRSLSGGVFLAPAVALFALFSWWPILWSVLISFQHFSYNPNEKPRWAGLENYRNLLADPNFFVAWKNVLLFVLLALVIGFFLPVALAVMVNELRHVRGLLRLGFYLPAILPVVVISVLWSYLYHPGEGGLFNTLLTPVNGRPVEWFYTDRMAIFAIVIMATWRGAGSTMIIYLAALGGISGDLYEAAEIDGAGLWRRLWHITLPQLLPIMSILLILQVIGTFKIFAEPWIMTKKKTMTIMSYVYEKAFLSMDAGVATAMSMTLFAVLVVLSLVYFRIQKKVLDRL